MSPHDCESDTCTFDEALIKHVGQCGRGQLRVVLLASLFQVANALAFMIPVFLFKDPIASKSWECNADAGAAQQAACSNAWASADAAAFCSLEPTAWRWSNQGKHAWVDPVNRQHEHLRPWLAACFQTCVHTLRRFPPLYCCLAGNSCCFVHICSCSCSLQEAYLSVGQR
jgi:hypothetical protein